MSAITNLNNSWSDAISTISDPIMQAEATYLLETYIAALSQQTALESNKVQSYSMAGMSFTYRNVGDGRKVVDKAKLDLYRYVYGTDSLIDLSKEGING